MTTETQYTAQLSGGRRSADGSKPDTRSRLARERRRGETGPYIPYLYIWGIAWIVQAFWSFAAQLREIAPIWPVATTAAAGALTGALLLVHRPQSSPGAIPWKLPAVAAGIVAVFFGLMRAELIDPVFWPLFKGLLLAAAYGLLRREFGAPLGWLSLWLLALTAVTGWFYLGYGPVMIGGMGGLSMIALALIFGAWRKGVQ